MNVTLKRNKSNDGELVFEGKAVGRTEETCTVHSAEAGCSCCQQLWFFEAFYSGTGADQDDDSFIFPEYESEPSERSFGKFMILQTKIDSLFHRLLTTMLLRSIQQGSFFSHQFRDSQFNSGAEFVMYNWSINNFINDSADAVQTFLESIHPYKDPNNVATQDALAAMTVSDLYLEGTSKDEQHLVTRPKNCSFEDDTGAYFDNIPTILTCCGTSKAY